MYESKEYEIGKWYEYLREFTFESSFIPLSEKEGKAMLNYHEEFHKRDRGKFTEENKVCLDSLEVRLNSLIHEYMEMNECNGVFLKLSLRSPKDSILASKRMKELLEEELKTFGDIGNNENKPEITSSDRLISFVRAQSKSLKVSDGPTALANLLSSRRIFTDLMLAFLQDSFELELILRRWSDKFLTELEFRGFVFGKKFTCLTQYYHLLYIPYIAEHHEEISEKICEFWEKNLKNRIPMDDYTIDFGLELRDGEYEVVVIELNPPAPLSGTSLFHELHDKHIIENGPFEFRYVKGIIPNAENQIFGPLKDLMDMKFPNYARIEQESIESQLAQQISLQPASQAPSLYFSTAVNNLTNIIWNCDLL